MFKLNIDSQSRYSGTTLTNLQSKAKIADYSHLFKRIGWCISFPLCTVNRSKDKARHHPLLCRPSQVDCLKDWGFRRLRNIPEGCKH